MKLIRTTMALLLMGAPVDAAFEETAFGARPMAMADAQTADAGGLGALTLNPAAMGQLRRYQISTGIRRIHQVAAGPLDRDGMTFGVGVPLDGPFLRGGLGAYWIQDTDEPISLDRTLGIAYGSRSWREIGPGTFDYGVTFKSLNRSGRRFPGSIGRIALDLGTFFRWDEDKSVGVSLLNLTRPSLDLGGFHDRAPLTFRAGYTQKVRRFTTSLDFSKREPSGAFRDTNSLGSGVEYTWATVKHGLFAARAGLDIGGFSNTWNMGAGWTIFGARLDYAVKIPMSNDNRWGHAVSLTYRFGQWDPEAEYERLLSTEMTYRQDLTRALESAEVKQWRLAEDLRQLRMEIEDLRRDLINKEAEAGIAEERAQKAERDLRLKKLEERRRQAQKRLERLKRDQERMRLANKQGLFEEDWKSYSRLKIEGVSDLLLIERVKQILRQYKGTGVDLGRANRELQSLQQR